MLQFKNWNDLVIYCCKKHVTKIFTYNPLIKKKLKYTNHICYITPQYSTGNFKIT